MNTVSGQELVDRLNELSKKAKKRLWIASPYLGEFNAIQRNLGPGNYSQLQFGLQTAR